MYQRSRIWSYDKFYIIFSLISWGNQDICKVFKVMVKLHQRPMRRLKIFDSRLYKKHTKRSILLSSTNIFNKQMLWYDKLNPYYASHASLAAFNFIGFLLRIYLHRDLYKFTSSCNIRFRVTTWSHTINFAQVKNTLQQMH